MLISVHRKSSARLGYIVLLLCYHTMTCVIFCCRSTLTRSLVAIATIVKGEHSVRTTLCSLPEYGQAVMLSTIRSGMATRLLPQSCGRCCTSGG